MPRLTTRGACGYAQQRVQHASDLTLNTLVASSRVLGIIDERLTNAVRHSRPAHSVLLFLDHRREVRPINHFIPASEHGETLTLFEFLR